MSINRVNISGNLTRDPELRVTTSGTQVISFGMALFDLPLTVCILAGCLGVLAALISMVVRGRRGIWGALDLMGGVSTILVGIAAIFL